VSAFIRSDERIHGVAVVIPTNHREIPGSTPGRYNLQIEITSLRPQTFFILCLPPFTLSEGSPTLRALERTDEKQWSVCVQNDHPEAERRYGGTEN